MCIYIHMHIGSPRRATAQAMFAHERAGMPLHSLVSLLVVVIVVCSSNSSL